jgi:hypothetical protein
VILLGRLWGIEFADTYVVHGNEGSAFSSSQNLRTIQMSLKVLVRYCRFKSYDFGNLGNARVLESSSRWKSALTLDIENPWRVF